MENPFTEIENKRLYPHRIVTTSKTEAKKHLQSLIDNKLITLDGLISTRIGEIQFQFLLNISACEIYDILTELEAAL